MLRRRTRPFQLGIYCDVRQSTVSFAVLVLALATLCLNCPVHASTVPHFIRPAAVKKGNRTAAFNAFELSEIFPDKNFQLKSVLLFSKRKPVCSGEAVNSGAKTTPPCRADGKYSDRISFRFKFDPGNNSSAIKIPDVSVQDGSGLHPRVKDFHIEKPDGTGSFTVVYNCTKANVTALVSVSVGVTASDTAKVSWQKTCGGGFNKYLIMTAEGLTSGVSPQEAAPMKSKTAVQLKVQYPQTSLDFETPLVVSKNPDIGVDLRTTVQKGMLTVKATTFSVLYTCHKKTRGQITLTVPIPPWKSATLTWTKDCGGTHPRNLRIELGQETVVDANGVRPKFNVSEKTTTRDAVKAQIYELSVSKNSLDFLITNADTSELHIQGAATTISNPNTLAVVSKDKRWFTLGEVYMSQDEKFVLKPKSSVHLKI